MRFKILKFPHGVKRSAFYLTILYASLRQSFNMYIQNLPLPPKFN